MALRGRKQGHGGTVHPNKAYTGPSPKKQAMKNMMGGGYSQEGHPLSGLSKGQLKKRTARAFGDLQQLREQGNERGVKHAKKAVNQLRHKLTVNILGGTHGQGFNPGLSQKGQHQATRQLLRAKLGSNFSKYYYTGGAQKTGQQKTIGNVRTSGPPQPTFGRKIGPPARRRKTGYGGY